MYFRDNEEDKTGASMTRTMFDDQQARAYLRGGFRGFKPPPKFSDFFLKSEGKEIESKRKKRDVGGGVTS